MMKMEPQLQHHWLDPMVGDWTCEGEAQMTPGEPPAKWTASETVRSLGGLWVVADGRGEMPGGGEVATIMTLGYDPARNRYIGTFVGSMMTHLWVYEGQLDESGKVLTLDTEGPVMTPGGGTARYRDVIELKSHDHRTLTSHMQQADGEWKTIMTAHYRRRT